MLANNSADRFTTIFGHSKEALMKLAADRASEYANATPYPHIVMDDFFSPAYLQDILREHELFGANTNTAKHYRSSNEEKLASREEDHFLPHTLALLHVLNSSPFLRFLERLTGIQHLIADPHFVGGGLHLTKRNGFLKIHADFNLHPEFRLDRRLNLLVYLNQEWPEEWGGHFELWDAEMTRCAKRVAPVFNRVVVFSTTSTSFHGQPDPVQCPDDRGRRSLALYYYTNGRPEEERHEQHNTLFRSRGAGDARPAGRVMKETAREFVRNITPPFLWNLAKRLKGGA